MKVVYAKTILEKMDDEMRTSWKLGKTIEMFLLTRDEWFQLTKIPYDKHSVHYYNGIPVTVE